MKIKIEKNKNLAEMLKYNHKNTRKSKLVALGNVAIRYFAGKKVVFECTDLNLEQFAMVECNYIEGEEKDFCLDPSAAKFIGDKIGKMDVTIYDNGDHSEITCGGATCIFANGKLEDTPSIECNFDELATDSKQVKISTKDLVWLFGSISADETCPRINGLFFDSENNCAVSTNGHTLFKLDQKNIPLENTIVTSRQIAQVIKAMNCDKKSDTYALRSYTKNRVFFNTESNGDKFVISAKPIDCEFPPYNQVIPKPGYFSGGIKITNEKVKQIIESIKGITSDKTMSVLLNVSENGSTWEAENPSTGKVSGDLGYAQGIDLEVRLNAGYLSLAMGDSKDANMLLSGPLDPALMVSGDRMSVVMPMRA